MPEHFRSRTDMVNWLIANCPRKAIVRALEKGRVEFLGGFKLIPPSNLPGWIFKIKDKNVCILCNDLEHKYEIRLVRCVPWDQWNGTFSRIGIRGTLNSGDNPLVYKELCDAEIGKR